MKYQKSSLIQLLKLVKEIVSERGNEWFKDSLYQELYSTGLDYGNNSPSAESFLRLQRKIIRVKALEFYKNIESTKLRAELVKDFQEMQWYKLLNQVEKQYLFTCYQVENMINYFISNNQAHEKIKSRPEFYSIEFSEKFITKSYSYFFSKSGDPIEISKINSLYAKLVFWAIETNNKLWIMDKSRKYHLDHMINIRNMISHRNSQSDYSQLLKYIDNIKRGDDTSYGFLVSIMTRIKNTLLV